MIYFRIFDEDFETDTSSAKISNGIITLGSSISADVCLLHRDFTNSFIEIKYQADSHELTLENDYDEVAIEAIETDLFLLTVENCSIIMSIDDAKIRGKTLADIKATGQAETNAASSTEEDQDFDGELTTPRLAASTSASNANSGEAKTDQGSFNNKAQSAKPLSGQTENQDTLDKGFLASINQPTLVRWASAMSLTSVALVVLGFTVFGSVPEVSPLAELNCTAKQAKAKKTEVPMLTINFKQPMAKPTIGHESCTTSRYLVGAQYFLEAGLNSLYDVNEDQVVGQISGDKLVFTGYTRSKHDIRKYLTNALYEASQKFKNTATVLTPEQLSKAIAFKVITKQKLLKKLTQLVEAQDIQGVLFDITPNDHLVIYASNGTSRTQATQISENYLRQKHLDMVVRTELIGLSNFGIASVIRGTNPFFISQSGQKYFEGSSIGPQIKLETISENTITFNLNGQLVEYPF